MNRYEEAIEKALEAKEITGKGVYNLACALALAGRLEDAMEELQACLKDGIFEDGDHLDTDPDLDALRERDDYKAFRASLD